MSDVSVDSQHPRPPLLAAITLAGKGDGVAVVGNLLHATLKAGWGPRCRAITMFEEAATAPSLRNKAEFAAALARAVLSARPEWIIANHLGLLRALEILPGRLRPPYAVFLHGIEAWRELTPAERRRVSGARLRLSNSRYTARRVVERNPDVGVIVACPLALPPSRLPRLPASTAQTPDLGAHAVLVVGRVSAAERYKGHDVLLAAWPSVRARVPTAQLIFAGGGDDVERLRRAASDTALGGSVQVLGFVDDQDLELLYRRAACFALPSTGEGFGLVYLEAMARGLPCVALADSAAADIVIDGVTGSLIDAQQPEPLAAALVDLLARPERRVALGGAGRARVESEFSQSQFERRAIAALAGAFGPAPFWVS